MSIANAGTNIRVTTYYQLQHVEGIKSKSGITIPLKISCQGLLISQLKYAHGCDTRLTLSLHL